MAGPVVYYIARLFFPKIPGNMVAQYGARGQAFCKAAQFIPVCFILGLICRVVPMDQNIAATSVAAARIIWIGRFLFVDAVGGKSNRKFALQLGAKWVTIAAILATKFGQVFSRAAHNQNVIHKLRFFTVPEI